MSTFFKEVSMMFKRILGKLVRGVPDMPEEAEESPVVGEYVPESELHSVINAAAEDGQSYVPWRVDADGEQWYRKVPTVHAMAADDEIEDEDNDDEDNDDEFSEDVNEYDDFEN
jgi:hypothetical protein